MLILVRTSFLTTLLTFLAVSNSHGIVITHTASDQDYIDLGNSYTSVGNLERNGNIRGSGTLITEQGGGSSRYVLTAAHLFNVTFPPEEFTVGGTTYNITNYTVHPDFDGTTFENDIAVVELDSLVSGLSPLSWHANDSDLTSGVDVISVGHGKTGDGQTGQIDGTQGTKRGAENTINEIGTNAPITPSPTHFEYRFYDPINPSARALEGMIAEFDSGGPVIADFGSGDTIVGVHSYVQNNDAGTLGTYGDDGGVTRVPLYDQWITDQVPEQSTAALLTGVFALIVSLTQRRFCRQKTL